MSVLARLARASGPRDLPWQIKQAGPIFDQSLALEMLTFMGEDVLEGMQAIREKRQPVFPSAR